jgi:hypothetical protein
MARCGFYQEPLKSVVHLGPPHLDPTHLGLDLGKGLCHRWPVPITVTEELCCLGPCQRRSVRPSTPSSSRSRSPTHPKESHCLCCMLLLSPPRAHRYLDHRLQHMLALPPRPYQCSDQAKRTFPSPNSPDEGD